MEQDKKIAGVAHEAGKGIVVAVNKWDLIEKETNTMRDFKRNRIGAAFSCLMPCYSYPWRKTEDVSGAGDG